MKADRRTTERLGLSLAGQRAAVASCLLFALSSCGEESTARYRIRVAINDNGVQRIGESVWSYRITENIGDSVNFDFEGEAVAIDMPGRGVLLAMPQLRESGGNDAPRDIRNIPEKLFAQRILAEHYQSQPTTRRSALGRAGLNREIAKRIGLSGRLRCPERYELMPNRPISDCPLFVLFTDREKPAIAQMIDPRDMARHLGVGVKLETVSVTITDQFPKEALRTLLPWTRSFVSKNAIYARWPNDPPATTGPTAGYRIYGSDLSAAD